jgi:hypothetical protein
MKGPTQLSVDGKITGLAPVELILVRALLELYAGGLGSDFCCSTTLL